MTKEEKQLLLADLCARLPYGVKCNIEGLPEPKELYSIAEEDGIFWNNGYYSTEEVKPYLRPMSSMTKEEKKEFSIFIGKTETYVQQVCLDADSMINPVIGGYKCVYWGLFDKCIDWLLAHHFDFRDLISKGLALEAPDDMYKTE